MSQEQIRFLEKNDELFLLSIPLLGTLFIMICWFASSEGYFYSAEYQFYNLIAGVLFLDGIHVIYSFILVLSVPELRQWSKAAATESKTPKFFKLFWVRTALVALAMGLIFYFLQFSPLTSHLPWVIAIYFFIEAFGPSQHTLAQMRGISFCYNSALRKSGEMYKEAEKDNVAKAEKNEKLLFQYLLFADFCTVIPFGIGKLGLHHVSLDLVRNFGVGLIFLTSVGILVNAYNAPKQNRTKKFLYLTRVLLYPLRIYVRPAYMVTSATHGTEYLVILRQMVKKSSATKAQQKKILWLTIAATLLYAPVYILTYQTVLNRSTSLNESYTVFAYAMMLHLVFRYTHYYVDSVLYRMKDIHTRASVAPLLVPAQKQAA